MELPISINFVLRVRIRVI